MSLNFSVRVKWQTCKLANIAVFIENMQPIAIHFNTYPLLHSHLLLQTQLASDRFDCVMNEAKIVIYNARKIAPDKLNLAQALRYNMQMRDALERILHLLTIGFDETTHSFVSVQLNEN